MTIAVITIVAGRHDHLRNQQHGLARSGRVPDVYVVVAMDDEQALEQTRTGPLAGVSCRIVMTSMDVGEHLPLAAARNLGAAEAIAAGADQLVFLDVDCIPSQSLIGAYRRSLDLTDHQALHCGVVRYLEPQPADRALDPTAVLDPEALLSRPHPARPQPQPGQRIASSSWELFWSLSFAVSVRTWRRLTGFHEEYVGYGAEDTDFGYAAHRAGVDLIWVGGADAYHQHHATSPQSESHLDDILRNATIFRRRWGFWPMLGWLQQFQADGRARYDEAADEWSRT